jgi:hypothetical protein
MTRGAKQVIDSFDDFSEQDKREVLAQHCRRYLTYCAALSSSET